MERDTPPEIDVKDMRAFGTDDGRFGLRLAGADGKAVDYVLPAQAVEDLETYLRYYKELREEATAQIAR